MGLGIIYKNPEFNNLLEGNEEIAVSDVIQKAYINVNERGTEAAAVTGKLINNYWKIYLNTFFSGKNNKEKMSNPETTNSIYSRSSISIDSN